MTTAEILALAASNVGQGALVSSAALCLDDAIRLAAKGDARHANRRALASISYSLGLFHPITKQVAAAINAEALVLGGSR